MTHFDSIDAIGVPAHTRKKHRRVLIPADIAREDIIHDLPDDQKICPHDGAILKHIGEETHEQLDIVPAKATCLRHVRLKYADALPLYRQAAMFKPIGVELDRTSLANWMIAYGQLTQSLINRLHYHLMDHSIIHMDETPVQVLNEPNKTPQSTSYMWAASSTAQSSQPILLFQY